MLFPSAFCNFYHTIGIWTELAHAILHSCMWFLNMRLSAEQGIISRKNLPIGPQVGIGEFLNKKAYSCLCQHSSRFWQLFSPKLTPFFLFLSFLLVLFYLLRKCLQILPPPGILLSFIKFKLSFI